MVAKKKGGVATAAPLIRVKVRRAILREVARRGDIIEMTQEDVQRHGYNVEVIKEQPKAVDMSKKKQVKQKAVKNAAAAKNVADDTDAENAAEKEARAADEVADEAKKKVDDAADAVEKKFRGV